MKNIKKMFGFSLAEIVVTLMIIGIIAALTLPQLINSTRKRENVAMLLKINSSLSQAVNKVEMELGPVGKTADWKDMTVLWPLFTAEFNTIKVCNAAETGCAVDETIKYLNGNDKMNYNGYQYGFRSSDGVWYNFSVGDCDATTGISTEDVGNCLGRFIIDVNGDKGPNKFGEDLFVFCMVKGKGIVPAGTDNNVDCTRADKGITCAAKVIREGEIKY